MVMDNENEDFDEIPSGSEDENLSDNSDDEAYRPGRDTDDDVSDDDDEEPPASIDDPGPSNQRKRQDPTVQRKWNWSKKDLPPHQTMENQLVPAGPAAVASAPLAMFLALFDDECMDLLVMETNRFRLQAGRTRIEPVDKQEIRTFIGICFFMTTVDLPNRRMYWSPRTHQAVVADAMTINRFEDILSVLHANDNELGRKPGQLGYDRLHKVRPLLSLVGMAFERCAEPEKCISVDEQIIPFKGKHSLKVYMLKEPKKWGYKVWVQAGQSGYVHRFEFAGDNVEQQKKVPSSEAVGKSGEVVLKLTDNQPKQSYVFFDNLFASPELLLELKKKDLRATCTIHSNRTRNCPLLCLKDMKKKGRGTCDFRSLDDESLMICQWFDNKVVMVASNVHGVEPKFKVRRYDRSQKQG